MHFHDAQSYTIQGLTWDTIYVGVDNKIELTGLNCSNLKIDIQPYATYKLDGCTLTIMPSLANKEHVITITAQGKSPFKINLHSARTTLNVLSLANKLIPVGVENISISSAKELRGVKPVVNCPWMREACRVLGYSLIIWSGSEVIYVEEIKGWQLSDKAKAELQRIRSGSTITFDNIKTKCPGDDNNVLSVIKFSIK